MPLQGRAAHPIRTVAISDCAITFDEELVRSYRAFLDRRRAVRPEAEYREPTEVEWREFQEHFQLRKLELGECGRPYGTPASTSTHASLNLNRLSELECLLGC